MHIMSSSLFELVTVDVLIFPTLAYFRLISKASGHCVEDPRHPPPRPPAPPCRHADLMFDSDGCQEYSRQDFTDLFPREFTDREIPHVTNLHGQVILTRDATTSRNLKCLCIEYLSEWV
jgi:hypothetical protein